METGTVLDLLELLPISVIMWAVLGLVLLVFGVYSAILLWHWKIYSTGKFTTVSNLIMYLSVSAVFVLLMIASALTYSFL